MSEISTAKNNCRVDLTPMVDLGFLLITFFVFTTSIHQPVAMKLFLPNDSQKNTVPPLAPAGKTLSIILAENTVAFYNGNNLHSLQFVNNKVVDVRNVIIDHLNSVRKKFGSSTDAIVLLKPTVSCTYKQVVDCLDEMTINGVKKYMLTEATKDESTALLYKQQ